MATVFRCDICNHEKDNRNEFLVRVDLPQADQYTRCEAGKMDERSYDMCADCVKALNAAILSRQAHFKKARTSTEGADIDYGVPRELR